MTSCSGLRVGDRVKLDADADLEPYGMVRQGQKGVVTFTAPGRADIRLDKLHPGLAPYDNCIWLIEPDTDGEVSLSVVRSVLMERVLKGAYHASYVAAAVSVGVGLVILDAEATARWIETCCRAFFE